MGPDAIDRPGRYTRGFNDALLLGTAPGHPSDGIPNFPLYPKVPSLPAPQTARKTPPKGICDVTDRQDSLWPSKQSTPDMCRRSRIAGRQARDRRVLVAGRPFSCWLLRRGRRH